MCVFVEYARARACVCVCVCVKFGWKSDSGCGYFGKTTEGVIFMGHPVGLSAYKMCAVNVVTCVRFFAILNAVIGCFISVCWVNWWTKCSLQETAKSTNADKRMSERFFLNWVPDPAVSVSTVIIRTHVTTTVHTKSCRQNVFFLRRRMYI